MGIVKWTLRQLGISFCILLLQPGPVQMVSAGFLPLAEIHSIGGVVSPCAGRSP